MQCAAARGDAQVSVSEPADEVEGLARRLLQRAAERVLLHHLLHRVAYLRRRAEEPVRRHQPADALVRTLKVVRVDEELQPPLAVLEVGEHGPGEELVPERLPEPLHLPARHRVVRAALDVPDALPPQLQLELCLAAPCGVLPPLVRQDFPGRSVVGDAPRERLQHQRRLLVVRQRVRHDEPRVVIEKRRQIHALVSPQQEREEVRLPQLVRLRPLESRLGPAALRYRAPFLQEPSFVEDPPHHRLRNAQPLEALQHVPDAPRPVLGVFSAELGDRLPAFVPEVGRWLRPSLLLDERLHADGPEVVQPVVGRLRPDPERPRHRRHGCPAFDLLDDPALELQRVA